ncbi:MAG: hypothetical protein HC786_12195 [Richelia sp. CSU_2_1]|nr:hypothetical protein [Richelia sp. CSU_2_1]
MLHPGNVRSNNPTSNIFDSKKSDRELAVCQFSIALPDTNFQISIKQARS